MAGIDYKHGAEFQRAVLRLMMLESNFCAKCIAVLQEDYFTGELRWFYRKMQGWYKTYQRPAIASFFVVEISKHSSPEKERYETEWKEILQSQPDSLYVRKEMTEYIRANIFCGGIKSSVGEYNAQNRHEAYRLAKVKIDEVQLIDFERERITNFDDIDQILDQASFQAKEAIPTGIRKIDEAMLGGMMPQTWTTFLGGSNCGKSMLGPNLAYYAATVGKRTFVTIHEDEEIPTKLRYLARFSGIPYNVLVLPKSERTEQHQEVIREAQRVMNQFVRLRFMYAGECFIESVVHEARFLMQTWGYHLFFNDYGQCLKTRAFKSLDDKYSVQGYIYQELKQICLELNIAGAGGAQVNRIGHKVNRSGTSLLRMTDVGDSWEICKKASNVITMNRSTVDMQNDRITYLLDKVRNGRCPVAVQCITNYARALTHEPYDETRQTQVEIPVDNDGERE